MARHIIASDAFGASISASWSNGDGDWGTLAFVAGGHVEPSGTATDSAIRRSAESYPRAQWSKTTVQQLNDASSGQVGASVLMQAGTDESSYSGFLAVVSQPKYVFYETNASFGFTLLASAGATVSSFAAGDTVSVQSDAAGNLSLWSEESGGLETSRLTLVDNTLAFGSPGLPLYAGTAVAGARATAWSGGDFVADDSAVARPLSMDMMIADAGEDFPAQLNSKAWW